MTDEIKATIARLRESMAIAQSDIISDDEGRWVNKDDWYAPLSMFAFSQSAWDNLPSILDALETAQAENAELRALVQVASQLLNGEEPILARIFDSGETRDWVYKDDWQFEAKKFLEDSENG